MTDAWTTTGRLLIVGFPGHELPRALTQRLQRGALGGVIYFKRNLPSVEQLCQLSREVLSSAAGSAPPLIGIDQEGGRVSRLPAPARKLPPMRRLGGARLELLEQAGAAVGAELASLGVNLNFAPVLDVDSNPDNPVIGDRAFSSEPERVAACAEAYARGLMAAGVAACGKHYPGHGDTSVDSHWALPRVTHPLARLEAVELLPFRALSERLPALMTAHVVYDALDPDVPATLSRELCTRWLRERLGFRGLLISDDLEMRALTETRSLGDGAVAAVEAGCDALLVCARPEAIEEAHEALTRRCERAPAFLQRCAEAAARVDALARRFPAVAPPQTPKLPSPALQAVLAALGS